MQKHRNLLSLMISSKTLTDMEDVSLPSWSTGQTILVIRARTLNLGLEELIVSGRSICLPIPRGHPIKRYPLLGLVPINSTCQPCLGKSGFKPNVCGILQKKLVSTAKLVKALIRWCLWDFEMLRVLFS